MGEKYNKSLIPASRNLRRNMTDEEKHIWYDFLKYLPYQVNRQKVIDNYIVDFYISKNKIAIEIDGIQHRMPDHKLADEKRDLHLRDLGINTLRYSNSDINCRFRAVCADILKNLGLTFEDLKTKTQKGPFEP